MAVGNDGSTYVYSSSAPPASGQATPATTTAPTTATTPATGSSAEPTLGLSTPATFAGTFEGVGQVRPTEIYGEGDASRAVFDITWQTWGGPDATGSGSAKYVTTGTVADAPLEPVTVVAFQLAACGGQLRYEAYEWYFPEYGQIFDPNQGIPTCPPQ